MHKVVVGTGMVCLICVAAITSMLVGRQLIPADQLSVFDALVGDSYEIFLVDKRTGHALPITTHFGNDRFPSLSPDGQQVAFVSWRDGNSEIYVMDVMTRTVHNLSRHPAQDSLPAWSPDGTMLAYTSYRDGNFDIYLVDFAAGETFNLTQNPGHDSQPAWTVDSQHLLFISDRDGSPMQFVLDLKQCAGMRVQRSNCWRVVQNIGNLEVVDQILSG